MAEEHDHLWSGEFLFSLQTETLPPTNEQLVERLRDRLRDLLHNVCDEELLEAIVTKDEGSCDECWFKSREEGAKEHE